MHVMYYSYILDNCPKRITLSSTGGATLYTSRLGSYNLVRYDDMLNAIYKHDSTNLAFLYKTKSGPWGVSQTLDQNLIILMIHLLL